MEIEKLQSSFEKFRKFSTNCGDRKPGVEALIEGLGKRLIMCPGSIYSNQRWSYAGGLIEQSIFITLKMKALKTALDVDVSTESILITGLLHNIGMVGEPDNGLDYLLPQESSWHRERGHLYRYNENLPKMPISHRSLHILQHYGIKLSLNEWVAIATAAGPAREENKFYVGAEPHLSLILSQARQWATCSE